MMFDIAPGLVELRGNLAKGVAFDKEESQSLTLLVRKDVEYSLPS